MTGTDRHWQVGMRALACAVWIFGAGACADNFRDSPAQEPVMTGRDAAPAPAAADPRAPAGDFDDMADAAMNADAPADGDESRKTGVPYESGGAAITRSTGEGGGHKSPARKVYYEGELKLEAKDAAAQIDAAVKRVKDLGGHAESQAKNAVVLLIPARAFVTTFDSLQKLGKVLDKKLVAADITDAYSDTALRQKLLRESVKKLEELLALATSAAERLALLREIGDMKAHLEELDAAMATLASMAKYSKLTLTVTEPVRAVASVRPPVVAALAWIDDLSPSANFAAAQAGAHGQRIELPVPAEFVVVPGKNYWLAESASAATFSATKLENQPKGDARFWAVAIKSRLAARFTVATIETRGKFQVIRMKDAADDTFRYDVGVYVDGDALVIAEAYYPDGGEEKRFAPNVLAALGAFEGKGAP